MEKNSFTSYLKRKTSRFTLIELLVVIAIMIYTTLTKSYASPSRQPQMGDPGGQRADVISPTVGICVDTDENSSYAVKPSHPGASNISFCDGSARWIERKTNCTTSMNQLKNFQYKVHWTYWASSLIWPK